MKMQRRDMLLIGLLVGSFSAIRAELRYMDAVKMGHVEGKSAYEWNKYRQEKVIDSKADTGSESVDAFLNTETSSDTQLILKGVPALYHVYRANKIRNYWQKSKEDITSLSDADVSFLKNERHAAWYDYKTDSGWISKDTVAWLAEPYIYPVIDGTVEFGVEELSKFDFVKGIMENIPQEHRPFIADNTKFVVGAAINRAIRVSVDQRTQGLNSQNLKIFAQDASIQIGCAATEEYLIKPLIGHDDSVLKELGVVGLRIAAIYAINSLAGK